MRQYIFENKKDDYEIVSSGTSFAKLVFIIKNVNIILFIIVTQVWNNNITLCLSKENKEEKYENK